MARGQHDQLNQDLIIEGSRKIHPLKRVQGQDYPMTVVEELDQWNKGQFYKIYATTQLISIVISDFQNPTTLNVANGNASESSLGLEGAGQNYFKDSSKPDGDACCEDSTLKDVSEMEWPNSPSETDFRDDTNLDGNSHRETSEDSTLSYMSYQPLLKGKKRKFVMSDDEDPDIIMNDLHEDDSDNLLAEEVQPRDNKAGSTTRRQFHSKADKRKKNNTVSNHDSDADSGESEKEEDVDETKRDTRGKVYLFSYLCFLIFVFLSL